MVPRKLAVISVPDKYLTKSLGEVVEADTDRQRRHHDRLHDELAVTPCSPRCAVWLLYGVQPLGVTSCGRAALIYLHAREERGQTIASGIDNMGDQEAHRHELAREWHAGAQTVGNDIHMGGSAGR